MGLIAKVEKQKLLLKKEKEVEPKLKSLKELSPKIEPEIKKTPISKPKPLVEELKTREIDLSSNTLDMKSIKEEIEKELHKTPQKKESKQVIKKELNNSAINFSSLKKNITQEIKLKKNRSIPKDPKLSFGRVQTGIEGLDDVMEGGLRTGSINLIGGGSGSGKSIFCTQFLINGINECEESGIYISFEENLNKFCQNYESFGWDIKKHIQDGKLAYFYFSPEQVNKFIESGGGVIRDTIEKIGAKRVVIDSLTAFSLLFSTDLERRRGLLKIFDTLNNWNVTSLMISEQEPDPDKHISSILEFQVDGVILLYNIRKGDVRERSLEVFKMRATKHSAKIFPMEISMNGVIIYPEETVF